MGRIKYIGGCVPSFLIAVVLDVVGVVLLFVGIFANLRIDGRFYGDFLIYTGSLLVFISLAFWILWYVGNVQLSDEDVGLKKRSSSIAQLARKLTERLSQKLKARVKCVEDGEECSDSSQVGSPADAAAAAHKASRVTWGRSTAYHNEGYEDCLDSPAVEKKVELEPEDKAEL